MIEKKITMGDGETFIVGFKEVGSNKDGIECHIMVKGLFGNKSVYNNFFLKGLSPDYKHFADWTIYNYKRDIEEKSTLLNEDWS